MAVWSNTLGREVKATGLLPTDSAPSLSTDGLNVSGMRSFSVTVECDAGQSFASSAGQFDVWWFDTFVGAWSLIPDAHQQVPPEAAGARRFTMSVDVSNPRGRIAFIPNGLSVTSGGLTQYYSAVGR